MHKYELYPRMAAQSQTCTQKKLSIREKTGEVRVVEQGAIDIDLLRQEEGQLTLWPEMRACGPPAKDLKRQANLFRFRGAWPYEFDGIARYIARFPEKVMNRDNPNEPYFRITPDWAQLVELATEGDRTNKRRFGRALMKDYVKPPSLYLDAGRMEAKDEEGKVKDVFWQGIICHPVIIRSIEVIGRGQLSVRDARLAANLGKNEKGEDRIKGTLGKLDILAYKPLFEDCFELGDSSARKARGYIFVDAAIYSRFYTTWREERNSDTFRRLYNPDKGRLEKKDHIIFWRGVLYFLETISSNPKAETLTRTGESLVDMLASIDPGQLGTDDRIKSVADVKVLIDQFCYLFNAMARKGYCEEVAAAPIFTTYRKGERGLEVVITYTRDKPRAAIKPYSSAYMEETLLKNEPLAGPEYGEDE